MIRDLDFRLPHLHIAQWLNIALIVIVVGVIISEVLDLKQQIRQANYSAVVSELRAALIERWIEAQILPRQSAEENALGLNPMRLLKQLPENYLGELDKTPDDVEDVWLFNTKHNCLIYVDVSGKQILHPLKKGNATNGMLGGWDVVPTQLAK